MKCSCFITHWQQKQKCEFQHYHTSVCPRSNVIYTRRTYTEIISFLFNLGETIQWKVHMVVLIIYPYWRDYQRFTPALYIHWTCGLMGSVSADWGVLHETLLFSLDECDYSRNDTFTFVHLSHLFSEGFVQRPVDGLWWSAAL